MNCWGMVWEWSYKVAESVREWKRMLLGDFRDKNQTHVGYQAYKFFPKVIKRVCTFSWNDMAKNVENAIKVSESLLYWVELTVNVSIFTLLYL